MSLACLEMSFVVKGLGAVILLFRLGYKTSVVCHNVNTQKVKIARGEQAAHLSLHIDIAPLRGFTSGFNYHYKQRLQY